MLPWLPGESLFSLCSRLHRLWGHTTSARSAETMFGRPRSGTHHDLPNSLAEFASRTDARFGTAVDIARERTLLRFYRPFLGAGDVTRAVEMMSGDSVAHLKFAMGLLTSRFRAHHPLKACRCCMARDIEEHGWAYWHLHHQFPGVWACTEHGGLLQTSSVKSTGVQRFLWHLPTQNWMDSGSFGLPVANLRSLSRLAGLVTNLVEREGSDGWLVAHSVQKTLRERLFDMGLVTAHGRTRLRTAAESYVAHCMGLRCVDEMVGLPNDIDEAVVQLGRLIRPLRTSTHPLRLLVAIDWLFKDAHDFCIAYAAKLDRGLGVHDTYDQAALESTDARAVAIEQLRRGDSARAAARCAGVDIVTVMAWAAAAGVAVRRRPKILAGELKDALVRDLRQGGAKAEAAARYGISVETVTRVLRTEVGLHSAWKTSRARAAQKKSREAWLEQLALHGVGGVKRARSSAPAAYAWLYRNDRSWLRENTPPGRSSAMRAPVSRVRWLERDELLSQSVKSAAQRLSSAQPGVPLKLWQIYQVVPALKPKLSALDRLPLTRSAIDAAVRR